MSARALATALLLASGCRGILGIDTPIVGPVDSSDPMDAATMIDAPTHPDGPLFPPPVDGPTPGKIQAVQDNYSDPQAATTVTVPFSLAQSTGDVNVVVVGWLGSLAQVQAVGDEQGNLYVAVAPPATNGNVRLAIYYASVTTGGLNAVGVAFDQPVSFPDVRIVEYRGLAQLGAFDTATTATGTGTACDSGPITTTHPDELLVGANMSTNALVIGGLGVGFDQRVLSQPDQDVLSDRVVAATGTFHATATLSTSNGWIMQLVGFAASGE